MTYKLIVQEDKELGCYVQFPQELLNSLSWKEGDKINWVDNKDGSFTLKKVK